MVDDPRDAETAASGTGGPAPEQNPSTSIQRSTADVPTPGAASRASPEPVRTPVDAATIDPDAPYTFRVDDLYTRREHKPVRELPRLVSDSVRLVQRAARREFRWVLVLTVVAGGLTAAQLLFARNLLAEVVRAQDSGTARSVVPDLVGFLAVFAVLGMVTMAINELKRILSELVARHAQLLVAMAAAEADLVDFERPGFHDRLQRALANASSRPLEMTFALIGIVSALATAAGISIALAFVQPVLLGLAIVAFGPVWLATRQRTRLTYRWQLDETGADRRRSYLLMLLTGRRQAKELRAFDLADDFSRRHTELWDGRIARLRVVARKRLMFGIIGQLVNAVLFGGIVGVLVWMLADGRTSLQDATVAAGAVLLLGQRMGQIVGGFGTLYESALFLGDVHEFLGAAVERRSSRPAAAPAEPLVELQVHDVWFRYPSSTQPALRGVEMAVRPGEVVALVGPNGSGKTTLAKVLAQLFEAERGSVTWNGIDVSSLDNAGLRDRVAVIFQDFEQYLFSAADNIGLGRVARLDDRDAIVAAAQRAGADTALAHLPDGYDTLLGPEYWGGSDLSIGQWQRVAIARAFFRDAELLIFDEPSSALDAEAEAALFARLRELATGRAVVVISHRFSTVTTADRIYVMEDGRVTESGSHESLIAEAGTYARLFAIQAAQYLPGIAPESPEPPGPPGRAK